MAINRNVFKRMGWLKVFCRPVTPSFFYIPVPNVRKTVTFRHTHLKIKPYL